MAVGISQGARWVGEGESVVQIITEDNDMHAAEERFLQVLHYAAAGVNELRVQDDAHMYNHKVRLRHALRINHCGKRPHCMRITRFSRGRKHRNATGQSLTCISMCRSVLLHCWDQLCLCSETSENLKPTGREMVCLAHT
jgi:hypothetical protein